MSNWKAISLTVLILISFAVATAGAAWLMILGANSNEDQARRTVYECPDGFSISVFTDGEAFNPETIRECISDEGDLSFTAPSRVMTLDEYEEMRQTEVSTDSG